MERGRPTFDQPYLNVNCNPQIEHSDVSWFLRRHNLSHMNEQVMQEVFTLLNGEPNWVWRNAAIDVHGVHMFVTFYSGSESNKFVVNVNRNNGVSSSCRQKSLRLRVSDGVESIWNRIKSSASSSIFGVLLGGGLKMLGFW